MRLLHPVEFKLKWVDPTESNYHSVLNIPTGETSYTDSITLWGQLTEDNIFAAKHKAIFSGHGTEVPHDGYFACYINDINLVTDDYNRLIGSMICEYCGLDVKWTINAIQPFGHQNGKANFIRLYFVKESRHGN